MVFYNFKSPTVCSFIFFHGDKSLTFFNLDDARVALTDLDARDRVVLWEELMESFERSVIGERHCDRADVR